MKKNETNHESNTEKRPCVSAERGMYPVERRDADTGTSGQGGVEAEWV